MTRSSEPPHESGPARGGSSALPFPGPRSHASGDVPGPFADRPTSDAYDALTDLFVGELPGGGNPVPKCAPITTPASPPAATASRHPPVVVRPAASHSMASTGHSKGPALRLRTHTDDHDVALRVAESEPAAARPNGQAPNGTIHPAAGPGPAPRRASASFEHEGGPALQAKFAAAPPAPRSVAFDQVVLGHLPVLAAAWLCQYARQTARDSGRPVAMLRLWKNQAYVDVFGAPGSHAAACHSLPDAIASSLALSDRFILACDDAPETLLPIDNCSITLLTGADQVGTVAAFRLLKSLAAPKPILETAAPAATDESGGKGTGGGAIRVAIMGSDESVSAPAWQRLSDAARRFLSSELVLAAYVPKIDSHPAATTLFAGPCPMSPLSVAEEINREARRRSASLPVPQSEGTRAAAVRVPHALALTPDPVHHSTLSESRSGVDADNVASVARSFRSASPVSSLPIATPDPPEVNSDLIDPGPADRIASAPSAAPPEHDTIDLEVPSLVSHVAGVTPIAAQCPYARDVELGLDGDGRAHLMVRAAADSSRSELLHLTAAAAWLSQHAELLHAAGIQLDASLSPTMHVFTHDPRRFTSVVHSAVRLHLLSIVSLDGRRGWFCAEVN